MTPVPQNIRARAAKLRAEIEHHRYLYHVLDRQEISDAALDSLKHELDALEQEYPSLRTPDSPTQRIGGQPLSSLAKVRHAVRMVSLGDVFSLEELEQWQARWQKVAAGATSEYLVDLKLDGLAISLIYERGLLVRGATRGDGSTGEDVTHSIRTIESVPLRLNVGRVPSKLAKLINNGTVEIRGEVVMLKRHFETLNAEQRALGNPEFANPRNVAAGSIRQLDPALTAARRLDFFAWELISDLGQSSWSESYQRLKELGIKSNPSARVCPTLAEVQKTYAEILSQRARLDFWIDGLVVKVNDRKLYQRLGIVGKAPRAAVAYKFPAEQVTTVVESIQLQVGRTGAITPVAHLRPVKVAGTTVSRATLHNAEEIERLDVRVGDTVILQKAGDIIPDVVQVLPKLRPAGSKPFRMAAVCPVCDSKLRQDQGGVIWYCANSHCPARQREGLYHFSSKKALDIEGLGPSTIDVLVDEGLVKTPADFFKLRSGQLVGLPLFAEKKSDNLVQAIQAVRRVPLDRFIYALGIRHVGEQTAIDLANHFRTIERLLSAAPADFELVPNIGAVVARSLADYFKPAKNRREIERLRGAMTIAPPPPATSSKLAGQTVVVTGTLGSMSREEAHAKIRSAGGTVGSAVSRGTSLLVVGTKPGSKQQTAEKLGVAVVDEAAFRRMVE